MKVQEIVAINIRKIRVGRKLSQENLAVDAQIDRTYVSRLERGLENPTIVVLQRLAEVLYTEIIKFFVVPSSNEPKPLPSSRRRK